MKKKIKQETGELTLGINLNKKNHPYSPKKITQQIFRFLIRKSEQSCNKSFCFNSPVHKFDKPLV